MNEASKLKGQPVKPRDAVELRPAQKLGSEDRQLGSEDRREKIMSAGRKVMDEYETTFRILAR